MSVRLVLLGNIWWNTNYVAPHYVYWTCVQTLFPIQAGGETLRSEIHKLIKLIWNKEKLPHQWKESIVVLVHKEWQN
jgi:hypothetical protein